MGKGDGEERKDSVLRGLSRMRRATTKEKPPKKKHKKNPHSAFRHFEV